MGSFTANIFKKGIKNVTINKDYQNFRLVLRYHYDDQTVNFMPCASGSLSV